MANSPQNIGDIWIFFYSVLSTYLAGIDRQMAPSGSFTPDALRCVAVPCGIVTQRTASGVKEPLV